MIDPRLKEIKIEVFREAHIWESVPQSGSSWEKSCGTSYI